MFYQVTGMSAPQNKNPVDTRARLGGAPEKRKRKTAPANAIRNRGPVDFIKIGGLIPQSKPSGGVANEKVDGGGVNLLSYGGTSPRDVKKNIKTT
jgi:hypothetical protein